MRARHVGMLAALAVMGASGTYVFVYLYRWEWNRALMASAIFIAAEVGLVAVLLFARIAELKKRLDVHGPVRTRTEERVRQRLRENSADPANPFAWLTKSHSNVFVPVLLGAGIVLSGLAWIVDRIARATARPAVESGLARRLAALQPPVGGLLGGEPADPYRPYRRSV